MQLPVLGNESHQQLRTVKLRCNTSCIDAQAVCSCNCDKRLLGTCTELKESYKCK